jgi:hypothetical protein
MAKRAKLEALRNQVLRMTSAADVEPIAADDDGGFHFSARYVGDWEVPADEEDDGDYDWKVPTAASRKMLDEMTKSFGCTWQNEGEKCWINFFIA